MAPTTPSRGLPGLLFATLFASLSALALKEMRLSAAAFAVSAPIESVVNTFTFPSPNSQYQLRSTYTGSAPLDFGLRYLVTAFLPGVAGWDRGFQIQQIYFLVSFFSIISIWSVEAGRGREKGRWTSFTSIWALFYQTVGGAIIIPLYYLVYMQESSQADYWSPASRRVRPAYAKALLPSLLIGYLLPTILMYLPFPDPDLYITQSLVAFWQITPFVVNLLLFCMPLAPSSSKKDAASDQDDIKLLSRLYITCFIVTATAHIGTILWCLLSTPPNSLVHALVRVPERDKFSMTGALHYIFQADYWIIFAAAVAGAFLTLWDLKRLGRTDLSLPKTALEMSMAVISVGPAATIAGVWYVRELIMAQKSKQ